MLMVTIQGNQVMYARFLVLKLRFDSSDVGASMVEYSLLVVLIAIVALIAVQLAGQELSTTYSDIASQVGDAGP